MFWPRTRLITIMFVWLHFNLSFCVKWWSQVLIRSKARTSCLNCHNRPCGKNLWVGPEKALFSTIVTTHPPTHPITNVVFLLFTKPNSFFRTRKHFGIRFFFQDQNIISDQICGETKTFCRDTNCFGPNLFFGLNLFFEPNLFSA